MQSKWYLESGERLLSLLKMVKQRCYIYTYREVIRWDGNQIWCMRWNSTPPSQHILSLNVPFQPLLSLYEIRTLGFTSYPRKLCLRIREFTGSPIPWIKGSRLQIESQNRINFQSKMSNLFLKKKKNLEIIDALQVQPNCAQTTQNQWNFEFRRRNPKKLRYEQLSA